MGRSSHGALFHPLAPPLGGAGPDRSCRSPAQELHIHDRADNKPGWVRVQPRQVENVEEEQAGSGQSILCWYVATRRVTFIPIILHVLSAVDYGAGGLQVWTVDADESQGST